MGRCGTCRSHTQHFCFVHQAFVCDGCLVSVESVHRRCVVRTYRNFIENSSFDWPPVCAVCAKELDADGDNVRRTCLHVEHASCIEASTSPHYNCSTCQTPLIDNTSTSPLSHAIGKRLRNMATVTRSSAPSITTASSWDDSDKWNTSTSRNTINLKLEQRTEYPNPQRQAESETTSKVVSETECSDGIGTQGVLKSKSNAEGTPSRVSMAKRTIPSPQQKRVDDLRLDLELLPQNKDGSSTAVRTVKRDVQSGGLITSTSMRKIMKFGNRRLIELRKAIFTNRRRLLTLITCVACIVLVSFLTSGEDDLNPVTKPSVEHVSLPHVRVNPAFIQPRKAVADQDRVQGVDQ